MPTIFLDRERTLRMDLNAFALFEEATGRNLFEGGLEKLSARDTRALLWAALVHEDKTLTLEQVGAMVTSANMADVAAALANLITSGAESPLDVTGQSVR